MFSSLKLNNFRRVRSNPNRPDFQFIVEDADKSTIPSLTDVTRFVDPWGYRTTEGRMVLASKDIYFKIGDVSLVMNLFEFNALVENMRVAVSNSTPDINVSLENRRKTLSEQYHEWLAANMNSIHEPISTTVVLGEGFIYNDDTPF